MGLLKNGHLLRCSGFLLRKRPLRPGPPTQKSPRRLTSDHFSTGPGPIGTTFLPFFHCF